MYPSPSAPPPPPVLGLPPPPAALARLAIDFALSPREARLLWLIAAPALEMRTFRAYRDRWPAGPWPDVRIACRLACDDRPFDGAALYRSLDRSILVRLELIQLRTAGDRAVARVALDVLRALDGRPPVLPPRLRGQASLLPFGQGWRAAAQTRLVAALAQMDAGAVRWICVDADPDDGTLDALAATGPVLCVDPSPALDESVLVCAQRIARMRRLRLLVRVTDACWPAARAWALEAPAGFVLERPRGLPPPPALSVQVAAERLSTDARRAIWRAEVGDALARPLAVHPAGRALILRCVDALRLREVAPTLAALEAELRARRRSEESGEVDPERVDFPTTFR